MDKGKILSLALSVFALFGLSGMASADLNITFNQTVNTFPELTDLILELVDVGLDTIIHVLQRLPGIAVLVLVVGIIIAVLVMVRKVFGSIGGFFSAITSSLKMK